MGGEVSSSQAREDSARAPPSVLGPPSHGAASRPAPPGGDPPNPLRTSAPLLVTLQGTVCCSEGAPWCGVEGCGETRPATSAR